MAKINAKTQAQLAVVREFVEPALQSIIPVSSQNAGESRSQRWLLFVRGVVPTGERVRNSSSACRNALRRLLRRAIQTPLCDRLVGHRWQAYREHLRKPIDIIIAELEQSGAVEYRAIDQLPEAIQGIVGKS